MYIEEERVNEKQKQIPLKTITKKRKIIEFILIATYILSVSILSFQTLYSSRAAGIDYYVDQASGSNTNDCLSAGSPCETIQGALDKAASDDIINIASGTYAEQITIPYNVRLVGTGANPSAVVISGGSSGTVISNSYISEIQNLTIQDGNRGIENLFQLQLQDVYISSNSGLNNGAGIYNQSTLVVHNGRIDGNTSNVEVSGMGGGLYNIGDATIVGTEFYENVANQGAGIYNDGSLHISNANLHDNPAALAGGGIFNAGTQDISDTTITTNSAPDGAGVYLQGAPYEDGTTTISGGSINNNSAENNGGGIYNNLAGQLTVNSGAVIDHNTAVNNGGGVYDNTYSYVVYYYDQYTIFDNAEVTNNRAQYGAGIYHRCEGTTNYKNALLVRNGTQLLSNDAVSDGGNGGAIYNERGRMRVEQSYFENNEAVFGAAIYNDYNDTDVSLFTIEETSINANNAANSGGGVYNRGITEVYKSTIFSNAAIAGSGGGIYNDNRITVMNSTFTANVAATDGGGINNGTNASAINNTITHATFVINEPFNISSENGNIRITNSILSHYQTPISAANCQGNITSNNGNISSDATCVSIFTNSNDQNGVDPGLATIADNGGLTWTHDLLEGSPALEAAYASNCLPDDQRSMSRPDPVNTTCDIGAVESSFASSVATYPEVFIANNGSDTGNECDNSGTPCATFNHALTKVDDAGIIHVLPGTGHIIEDVSVDKNVSISGVNPSTTGVNGSFSIQQTEGTTAVTVDIENLIIQEEASGIVGITNQEGADSPGNDLYIGNVVVQGHCCGGGVVTGAGTKTEIFESTIAENQGNEFGGGIENHGDMEIYKSTISGNHALATLAQGGVGGGIYNGNPFEETPATLYIENSTISGNIAHEGYGFSGYAGGIITHNGSTTEMVNVTVANNTAQTGIGNGIINDTAGSTTVFNTIIANGESNNCSGAITSEGYNIARDYSCSLTSLGDQQGIDSQIATLGDNGGPTFTHAITSSSPAYDTGNQLSSSGLYNAPSDDQRSKARPDNLNWDVGAYEAGELVTTGDAYISTTGDDEGGANNCQNPSNRCATFAHALTQVGDGNTIYAAAGIYYEHGVAVDTNVTIQGEDSDPNNTVINGEAADTVFYVGEYTVSMENITISGGSGTEGGGIQNAGDLTLTQCNVQDNYASDFGGAIENYNTLHLIRTAIKDNSTYYTGGGIDNYTGGWGSLTIEQSEISGNEVTSASSDGGGFWADCPTEIINSTISNNTAAEGGGMYLYNETTIASSTITNNGGSLSENISGNILGTNTNIELKDTIISDPHFTNQNCYSYNTTFTSVGGNIDTDNTCNLTDPTDQPNTSSANIELGPLQDNGGYTQTHALGATSYAIDSAYCNLGCPAVDQRGVNRPQLSAYDSGAYEYDGIQEESIDLEVSKVVDNETPTIGSQVEFMISVLNQGDITATGVEITDILPSGYSYVSHSLSQGTYSDSTGLWEVGDVDTTVTEVLQIQANVQASGEYENIAEVIEANETDTDSTPNNHNPLEDDQASASVTPTLGGDAYVSPSGDDQGGANNCHNPSNRCATIAHALTQVNEDGTIYAAEGTYNESSLEISKNVTITGEALNPNSTIIDGQVSDRIMNVQAGKNLRLYYFTLRNGATQGTDQMGGGIRNYGNLEIGYCVISDNSAYYGGGVANVEYSSMTMYDSAIRNNSANISAGGIYNGIDAPLIIDRSELSGNATNFGGEAGAIYAIGNYEITNTTISQNMGFDPNYGGGISSWAAQGIIENSTFFENYGDNITVHTGAVSVLNTIVANTTAGFNCRQTGGVITTNGGNIDSDGSCGFNGTYDIGTNDPQLGPLQYNGGVYPLLSHLPSEESPVVDGGHPDCSSNPELCTDVDQRGVSRPQLTEWDSGAIELEGIVLPDDVYVSPSGDDAENDCQDPGNRCLTFNHALTQVANNGTVHAAQGVYYQNNISIDDISVSIVSDSGNPEDTIIDGEEGDYRIFTISYSGDAIIDSFTIRGGRAIEAYGGGIFNDGGSVELDNSIVENNYAFYGDGGGIKNRCGTFDIYDSKISNNEVSYNDGGGISNLDQGSCLGETIMTIDNSEISGNRLYTEYFSGYGGNGPGIYNSGTLTISNSSITGNIYSNDQRGGGGIFNERSYSNYTGDLFLTNVTISNNEAYEGGGIYNEMGHVELTHATVMENGKNNLVDSSPSTIVLQNSIIGNPEYGDNCISYGGNYISNGGNIDTDDTCQLDQLSDYPNSTLTLYEDYAPLDYYGAETETHPVLLGSLPVDNADCTEGCEAVDQRGVVRPQLEGYDIGAFELEPGWEPPIPADAYVSPDGNDEGGLNDCQDSENRCATFAHALTQVEDGRNIYAAPGTYFESGIIVQKNVHIIGEDSDPDNTIINANEEDFVLGIDYEWEEDIVYDVFIDNISFINGYSSNGGGIINSSYLELKNCVVRDNYSDFVGGGIVNYNQLYLFETAVINNDSYGNGGGIYLEGGFEWAWTYIENSEISGNFAGDEQNGGGIYAYYENDLTIQNSTISGNATNGGQGGGIYTTTGTFIEQSTIADNNADNLFAIEGSSVWVANTIFAQGSCEIFPEATFESDGGNIDETNATCVPDPDLSDILNTDAELGPLANYGGPTRTHFILETSPAYNSASWGPETDQRGFPRPALGDYDRGAFELDEDFEPPEPLDAYVDGDDGNDSGDCSDPFNRCETITYALSQVGNGRTVFVAQGYYYESSLIVNKNVTIYGESEDPETTVIDADYEDFVFNIESGIAVEISGLTIQRGFTESGGGAGIRNYGNVTVSNCIVDNNTSYYGHGGGIHSNGEEATLLVENSAIRDNFTWDGHGAGIYNDQGSAMVIASEISGNEAYAPYDEAAGRGGGVANNDIMTIENTTISNNEANDGGGGIYNTGSLQMENGTVTQNSYRNIYNYFSADFTTKNSIIAGTQEESDSDCEYYGTFTSLGGNIDSDDSCNLTQGTDLPSTDPQLQELGFNGSSTQTHSLEETSPAIDQADCSSGCLDVDQRGISRPQREGYDIGALEKKLQHDSYVAKTGTDVDNTCMDEIYPCLTVEHGLEEVGDGYTVYIAPGTYNEGNLHAGNVTIQGQDQETPNNTVVSGLNIPGPVFSIDSEKNVTIDSLTITDGSGKDQWGDGDLYGGGIFNNGDLILRNSIVENNSASEWGSGGGIYSAWDDYGTTLVIEDSIIRDNFGVYQGGGIASEYSLVIKNTEISGNSSSNYSAGISIQGIGGTITNSTISNNTRTSPSYWGASGIEAINGGLTLTNVTILENDERNIFTSEDVQFHNTIIGNPESGENCFLSSWGGAYISLGGNIATDSSCNLTQPSDQQDTLFTSGLHYLPLANNGGLSQTHAITLISPALDTAYCDSPEECPIIDQRGIERPQRVNSDVGAYEFQDPPLPHDSYVAMPADGGDDQGGQNTCEDFENPCETIEHGLAQVGDGFSVFIYPGEYNEAGLDINKNVKIIGQEIDPSNTTVNGEGLNDRIFTVAEEKTVTIDNLTLINGDTLFDGGAIWNKGNLEIDNCIISGNSSTFYGGGIANGGDNGAPIPATLTITNCAIRNNESGWTGGGIDVYSGMVVMTESEVSDNTSGSGGGIFNVATFTIVNSTISGNTATEGGGIFNGKSMVLTHATVANNSMNNIHENSPNTLTCKNTIVADPASGNNCFLGEDGDILTEGGNFDTDNTCVFTDPNDHPNTNPFLEELNYNGSYTRTHALPNFSPAVDSGDLTCSQ